MTARPSAILVVEDDTDFRELLVEHLAAAGHRVLAARDGAEALDSLADGRHAIGLVLLDLRMPVVDGFEVCRRLDRGQPRAGPPIVIMTAEHDMRDVEAARCVVGVLHKPLDLARLEALVQAHVRL